MSQTGNVQREPLKNIGAQDILNIEYSYSGTLRKEGKIERGIQKLSSVKWRQVFVVISQGCTYIFNDEASTHPKKSFSLRQYNRIELYSIEGGSHILNHCFRLVPRERGVKEINLACTDEENRKVWMKHFDLEIMKANSPNKKPKQREIDIHSQVEKTPKTLQQEKNTSKSEVSKNSGLEYDDIDEISQGMRYTETPGQTLKKKPATLPKPKVSVSPTASPNSPESQNCYYNADTDTQEQQKDGPIYSNAQITEPPQKYENFVSMPKVDIFDGDSSEASSTISKQSENGVFLIRKGKETEHVLVVRNDSHAKNYANFRIYQTNEEGGICLKTEESEQHPSFNSLHKLVQYYRESQLPWSTIKLTSQYRLT